MQPLNSLTITNDVNVVCLSVCLLCLLCVGLYLPVCVCLYVPMWGMCVGVSACLCLIVCAYVGDVCVCVPACLCLIVCAYVGDVWVCLPVCVWLCVHVCRSVYGIYNEKSSHNCTVKNIMISVKRYVLEVMWCIASCTIKQKNDLFDVIFSF